jgi:ATP-dependent protease ClpP protease subunit
MITTRLRILILLVFLLSSSVLHADIVTLKDGTVIEGVVVKETGAEVVIEITIANIKTTKKFPRYKVKSIEHTTTAPDDAHPNKNTLDDEQTTSPRTTTDRSKRATRPTRTRSGRTPKGTKPARTNYIVIPIEGMIGEQTNADGLKKALKIASRKKIEHIVFTIDSPGGYIYDAVETLKVLKEYDDAMTYHAVVIEGAISAASVYVAAADHIYVRPDARVGGAVSYTNDASTGSKEVDAKFNSIWAAEVAARAESKGYPAEIFRAMVVLDAEVWMDNEGAISSSRPMGSGTAQQIDTRNTILTIRAAQMIQIGMAKEFTGPMSELGELLGVEGWNEIKGVGERSMVKAAKERETIKEKMDFAQKVYEDTIKEYEEHHPIAYSDYVRLLILNRRSNQLYRDPNEGIDAQDAVSLQRWRDRSRRAIADLDIMLDALEEMASLSQQAVRIGALHIGISTDQGEERYQSTIKSREWLVANLNRIPFTSEGTIAPPP